MLKLARLLSPLFDKTASYRFSSASRSPLLVRLARASTARRLCLKMSVGFASVTGRDSLLKHIRLTSATPSDLMHNAQTHQLLLLLQRVSAIRIGIADGRTFKEVRMSEHRFARRSFARQKRE